MHLDMGQLWSEGKEGKDEELFYWFWLTEIPLILEI